MRNILLTFTLLISSQILFCQNIDEIEFEKTIKAETSIALNKFLYSKSKENIKKLDSIKTIERKGLKENITGTWEFFNGECSCCVKVENTKKKTVKYIVITENEISFYDNKISEKNLTQTEIIEFTNQYDMFSDLTSLVYKDKNIWDFKVDKTNKYLKIYHSGNETENGRTSKVSGIVTQYYKRVK